MDVFDLRGQRDHPSLGAHEECRVCLHQRVTECANTHLLTYLLSHGVEPFLRSSQLCSHSRTSQYFKEPEGSIPCSQNPPLLPQPYQSNPYYPIISSIIHFNIVHPPTSWSSQWSPSLWLSHQYPTCIPLRPHSCRVQVMKLLIRQFSPASCHFIPLWANSTRIHATLNKFNRDLKCSTESENHCYYGVMNVIRFRADDLNTFCKLSAKVLEKINE
jgi:hypothetical protein